MESKNKLRDFKSLRNTFVFIMAFLLIMILVEGTRSHNFLNSYFLILHIMLFLFLGSLLYYRVKDGDL